MTWAKLKDVLGGKSLSAAYVIVLVVIYLAKYLGDKNIFPIWYLVSVSVINFIMLLLYYIYIPSTIKDFDHLIDYSIKNRENIKSYRNDRKFNIVLTNLPPEHDAKRERLKRLFLSDKEEDQHELNKEINAIYFDAIKYYCEKSYDGQNHSRSIVRNIITLLFFSLMFLYIYRIVTLIIE